MKRVNIMYNIRKMKTAKELLELLKQTVNEKANGATKLMYQQTKKDKMSFWHGQYMAFNEMYSLLCNLENHI
jgi:hypothetical protein